MGFGNTGPLSCGVDPETESDECGNKRQDFARLLFLPSTYKLLVSSVSHTYSSARRSSSISNTISMGGNQSVPKITKQDRAILESVLLMCPAAPNEM